MRNKATVISTAIKATMLAVTMGVSADFDLYLQKFETDAHGAVIYDATGQAVPKGPQRLAHTQGNLITNAGMDYFGNISLQSSYIVRSWGTHCRVGGGSTAPQFTDTALTNQIAWQSRSTDSDHSFVWGIGDDLNKIIFTVNFTFGVGAAAGNLTEIGLSVGQNANLQTHALFVDAGGSPVVVQVAGDEQLVVRYRTKLSVSMADAVFNVTTSPVPVAYTLTLRPSGVGTTNMGTPSVTGVFGYNSANIYAFTGVSSGIGPATGAPTGTSNSTPNAPVTYDPYVPGSFESTGHALIQPTAMNFANIGALQIRNALFEWQLGISPRLTKVSPETLKISIKTKWVRA